MNTERNEQTTGAWTTSGQRFTITRNVREHQGGLLSKRVPVQRDFDFVIKEPTLAVLEEITKIQASFELGEDITTDQAREILLANKDKACRIVALAVMSESRNEYLKIGPLGFWVKNNHEVRKLARFFSRNVEPSNLLKLVRIVNVMCNFPDFVLALRLMQVAKEGKINLKTKSYV